MRPMEVKHPSASHRRLARTNRRQAVSAGATRGRASRMSSSMGYPMATLWSVRSPCRSRCRHRLDRRFSSLHALQTDRRPSVPRARRCERSASTMRRAHRHLRWQQQPFSRMALRLPSRLRVGRRSFTCHLHPRQPFCGSKSLPRACTVQVVAMVQREPCVAVTRHPPPSCLQPRLGHPTLRPRRSGRRGRRPPLAQMVTGPARMATRARMMASSRLLQA